MEKLVEAIDHFPDKACHDGLCSVCSFLYFLMTHLYRHVKAPKICYDADSEDTYATMVGHNDLRHGRHAHGVASQCAIHTIFGWCLEGGSLYASVYAIDEPNLLLFGNLAGQLDELGVVCLMHVGKTWTGWEVLSA